MSASIAAGVVGNQVRNLRNRFKQGMIEAIQRDGIPNGVATVSSVTLNDLMVHVASLADAVEEMGKKS